MMANGGNAGGDKPLLALLLAGALILLAVLLVGLIFWIGQPRATAPAPRPAPAPAPAPPPAPPPAPTPTPIDYTQRVETFIEDGFAFPLGATRREILASQGTPEQEHIEQRPNRHDPTITDEIDTLEYPGLIVVLYHATANNRDILQRVTVTEARYPMRWGLRVGAPAARVIQTLGPPTRRTGTTLVYIDEPAGNTVTFHTRREVITAIEWQYYVD